MATGKALDGKPYAGNPHVRFDEGEVASVATPRRGSLLYKTLLKSFMLAATLALLGAASSAWATAPQSYMDACVGGPGEIHLEGWAYDPDTPSQSIDIWVYIASMASQSRYDERVVTANISRADVNSAFNIGGNHGFSVDIPIADPGVYYVSAFALDSGNGDPSSPMSKQVTVTENNYLTLLEDTSEPVGTAARWYVNMVSNGTNRVRLPDAGTVAFKVYDCGGKTDDWGGASNGTLSLIAPAGYAFQLTGSISLKYWRDNPSACATLTVYDGGDDTAARLIDGATNAGVGGVWTSIGTVVSSGPNMTLRFNDPRSYVSPEGAGGLDLTVKLVRLGGTHAITINNPATGGVVASSPAAAPYGGTVTLTATPASGCLLVGLSVVDGAGDAVDVDWTAWSNVATFSMPAALSATVTPTFATNLTAAGGLFIDMPATGTNSVAIPDGVQSFKVYDDGGKDGNYSSNCDGTLVLTAPAGYVLQLSGTIKTPQSYASLTVCDGGDDTAARLINGAASPSWGGRTDIGKVVSSGPCMTLLFGSSRSLVHEGLDLTVKLVADEERPIHGLGEVAGGSVAASVSGAAATQARGNDVVTLTATPSEGFMPIALGVVDGDGDAVPVSWNGPFYDTATFVMRGSAATVTSVFTNSLTADGGLWINMPATGSTTLAIPAGVQSFKVYDDGGKNGEYSPNCDGTLVLTAPEGHLLRLSGRVWTFPQESRDALTAYDGGDDTAPKLVDRLSWGGVQGWRTFDPVTSTTRCMALRFESALSWNGLDLTVEVVRDTFYNVFVRNPDAGGTVSSSLKSAQAGNVVTLTSVPDPGWLLRDIRVEYTEGDAVDVDVSDMRWYGGTDVATFTMPDRDVFVIPEFTEDPTAEGGLFIDLPTSPYADPATKTVNIPAGVRSFKVYDDGGSDGSPSPDNGSSLVMTAPADHVLRISGSIEALDHDRGFLCVYDGASPWLNLVLDMSGAGPSVQVAVPAVTSSGRSMAVYFRSTGDVPCAGLDLTVTVIGADVIGYETWAAASGVSGAWDETDALGIHNVFRYAFDKPTGAFENPPLLDIAIEGGNAVVKTPPVANTAGFAVSVVESSDVAGAAVTRWRSPDATGRVEFPMEGAASRFYRLSAMPESELGGVQLWKDGPYWAECNVGAAKPEEYGCYFWWGDTVGYTHNGSEWVSVKDGASIQFSPSGTAASTSGKDNAALLSEGWIDSTGNFTAAHDAATARLGAPWRMPTDAEFVALISNCTTTWTTRNGVYGWLVTGKGVYADRSIFLPAAGYGADSGLGYLGSVGSFGRYWSSTPSSASATNASGLGFDSNYFVRGFYGRWVGQSVRPVRTPAR